MKKLILLTCLVIVVFVGYKIATSGPPGHIKLDAPGARMQLSSGLWYSVNIKPDAGELEVKAGTYRPRMLEIVKESGPDKWRIYSTGPWGKLGTIKVKKDETTVVKAGPAILVSADVQRRSGSRSVSIGFSITGQAGEQYSPHVTRNGRDLGTPKLKIVDESQKVLASGKFEYG
ncbi:MAG: hypothetical protein ACYTFK_00645 [Planctomycetota bacterium]|jgi:hypothetical protein